MSATTAINNGIRGSVVTGLPFEDYVALPEVHATGLKDMLVSPRLYKYRKDNPRADKDAFRVGRASHTSILEPDLFALEYAVWLAKFGRRGTNKHKEFCEANAGRTILTEAQYRLALKLRDSVRSHAVAGQILTDGAPEVTMKWQHARSGLMCKARVDWLGQFVIDLKTTRNPAPGKFASDAARFGYAMQLAFYVDGVAAATGDFRQAKIVAAQNVEPYDVVVFDIPDDVYAFGKQQYEDAIDLLLRCTESGEWPGVAPSEEVTLQLPSWATPEAEEEEITFGGESML